MVSKKSGMRMRKTKVTDMMGKGEVRSKGK